MTKAPAKPAKHKGSQEFQSALEAILSGYLRAYSKEPFSKAHPLWAEFTRAASNITAAAQIARFSNIIVRWSVGQGRWATIPWIAAFDSRETSKISEGVYVIYLFRADMSGVYLTLNQGTKSVSGIRASAAASELRKRAERMRMRSRSLEKLGFDVREGIDLRSNVLLSRGYETSTVAYKLYSRGEIPPDDMLLSDLEETLEVYEKIILS